jgi:glutathione S-transferase
MSYFAEPAGRLAFEKFVKKRLNMPPNDAAVTDALKSLDVFFDVAEETLQRQGYMAGDEFSLVDVYYIPLIQRLFVMGHGDLVTSREAVGGWWSRCINRPAMSQMFEGDRTDGAAGSR